MLEKFSLPTILKQNAIHNNTSSSSSSLSKYRIGNIDIVGPISFIGKGSFGYTLKCFHEKTNESLVLKIDLKKKYALWETIIHAKVSLLSLLQNKNINQN